MSRIFLIGFLSLLLSHANAQLQTEPADTGAVREVSLSHLQQDGKTMIALTFGQSNAGNYGQRAYTPHNAAVYNYYKGKLYTAKDPLFGATRTIGNGSVWSRLGDMLIDSGLYSKVIIIPIAVGGSSIERWATGDCFDKLQQTLNYLDSQHIRLTHIFWHQGETDNILNTSTAKYMEQLGIILQTIRKTQSADLYISLASFYSGSVTKPLGVDIAIRKAQQEFINENKTVLEGPDTDTLIHAIHRYDSVHFSDFGIQAFARLWLKAIKKKNEKYHLSELDNK